MNKIKYSETKTDKLFKRKFNKFTHVKKEDKEAKNVNNTKKPNNDTRSKLNKNNKNKNLNSNNNNIKFLNNNNSDFNSNNPNCLDNLIDLNITKEDSLKNTSRSDSTENYKNNSNNIYMYYSKGFTNDSKETYKHEENEYANIIGCSKSSKFFSFN